MIFYSLSYLVRNMNRPRVRLFNSPASSSMCGEPTAQKKVSNIE